MDTAEELPTVIAFCAGYGGIERGLDLAGIEHRVIAYVEIEAFAIANLVNKMETGQLPPAPIYTDLKTFPAHLFRDRVDLITGGYPCQPFSAAGQRKGTDDPRHLWPFIRRHIEAIRPHRVFFENVEGHISLGLSSVIADLEEDGYRSAWGIFSAVEVGAPHQRKRVFIMADSDGSGQQAQRNKPWTERQSQAISKPSQLDREFPNSGNNRMSIRHAELGQQGQKRKANNANPPCTTLSNSFDKGLERHTGHGAQCYDEGRHGAKEERSIGQSSVCNRESSEWPPEPRLGRVANGIADRVDRIRLLGNGVVPQTAAKAWKVLSERLV